MMSAISKARLTEAEYLEFERSADVKHEYYHGEVFAMAGASPQHNEIKDNLILEIGAQLKGGPCRTYSSDQRVKIDRTGLYTYPDLLIVCGPREFDRHDVNTLINPNVVIEVLSKSTEGHDRGFKFHQYKLLPSVREYVLVAQDRRIIERLVRQNDGTWILTIFDDPAGAFSLATVPVTVPLADVYRDVELDEQPPRESQ